MFGLTLQKLKNPLLDVIGTQIVISGTTANRIINFNNEFQSLAKSIRINNEDGTNSLTYSVNNQPFVHLAAGARDPISDEWIEQVEIRPHPTTGKWTLQCSIVKVVDAVLKRRTGL